MGDNQDESELDKGFPAADPLKKMEKKRVFIDNKLFRKKIVAAQKQLMVKKNGLVS